MQDKALIAQKGKAIRDMFKLGYWDEEFSTARMRESNPLANMAMLGGFIIDKRSLPPEFQDL